MKALLKRVAGGLIIGSVYATGAIGILGIVGGLGTGIAKWATDDSFKKYEEYDKVQEIVEKSLADELAELNQARENGDITDGEYLKLKEKLDKDSHDDLIDKAVKEIFGDDEEYKGLLKKDEQLKKACISLFSIGGGTLAFFAVGAWTELFDAMISKGDDLIDDAYYISEENKRRKKEKNLSKEMNEYYEEIE